MDRHFIASMILKNHRKELAFCQLIFFGLAITLVQPERLRNPALYADKKAL
jgi:hypothetical protein